MAEAEVKNYAVNRIGVAFLLAIVGVGVLGCMVVAAVLIVQYFHTGADLGFTATSVGVLFGCIALIVGATQRLVGLMTWVGPVLTISDAGVLYRLASDQLAPWSAIREIKVSPRAAGPELVLEPQFAKEFRWKGGIAKTLKPKALVVATAVLKGRAGEVAYELQSRWEAAQTGRPRPATAPAPEPDAPARRPYLTLALILLLVAIFVAEGWSGAGPLSALTANPDALAAIGGVVAEAVWRQHQYWRLFSGPLMHANAPQLLVNGIVLYVAGRELERYLGRGWLALLFAAGALGGAAASATTLFGAPVVSVGASGAIMGLIGALFALAGRLEPQGRKRLRQQTAQLIVPALLPLGSANHVFVGDYAPHFGGLVAGVMVALLLRSLWRSDEASPPYAKVAGALGAYFAAAATAIIPIARAWASLAQG